MHSKLAQLQHNPYGRAGACIDIAPWGLHHSKAAWGEDAKQWRPARWQEGRSVNAVKRTPSGAMRWLPFSDGRQNCIGQQLATVRPLHALFRLIARNCIRVARSQRVPQMPAAPNSA